MQRSKRLIAGAAAVALAVPWVWAGDVNISVNINTRRTTIAEDEVIVETGEEQRAEVLTTRQIVHEAFVPATTTTIIRETERVYVSEPPPPVVKETIVLETKPAPAAIWVPGYWYYQDTGTIRRYVWVSGGWRIPPPGMVEWVPGRYVKSSRGYVWVNGYWKGKSVTTVHAYVSTPPPPPRVEVIPASPGPSYVWVAGYWLWSPGRATYIWRPGRWVIRKPGYVYVAPSYRYTPKGYVFVPGYYDRPIAKRGVVYRPIVFKDPRHVTVIRPTRTIRFKTRLRRPVVKRTTPIKRGVAGPPPHGTVRVIKRHKAPKRPAGPTVIRKSKSIKK